MTPFAAVTVSDPDVGQTETVTIAYTAANGSFGNLGGFTGAAGSYSFTGTTAAAQAALHGLVFTPTANQVAPGNTVSTAFALSVSDGVAAPVSNSQTTVVATSINDSPALGGITTAPQAVADNATVTPFAAVTVSDPDVGQTETVTIAYTAANGSFGNLGGFTGAAGSYSFTGTTAAAQAALHGLVFTPTANQVAPGNTVSTAFALSVSDGVAAPVSNSQTTVVATSINDSPALGGITTAPQAVADNATVTPFAAVTVSDPDVGQTETVTIAYTAANGSFGNLGGFTGAAGSYSFTGTTAAAQAALHGLVFTPTANQVAPGNTVSTAFALSVSDGVAAPVSNSQTTVVATSINDSPALGGITTAPQAVADNATVTPFAAVTVSDPDVGQTETVTIAYTAANGSFGNLGGFTGAAGSYSFTGTTAAAQAALHGLVFTPTANQVAPGNTVSTAFALSVSDGVAAPVSNSQTTVVATSINDSPALGGITTAPQAVADNATVTPFAAVTVSDPDVGQTETVTIAYTAANGSFGNLGGFTGAAGSYSFTGTTAAAQAALHGLVFTPTANQVAPGNTVSTAFALSVSDGVAAPVSNSQTTVVATSINDSPALGGITTAPQAVADNATVTPFAAVTVSDPDVGQTETVTIAYTAANGSFGNLGGFTGAAGSYSFTGTTAAAQAALHGLVFTPTANQVAPGNTVSTAFALSVSDGVAAPVSNSQTTVVATSINDSPALGGITTAPQAVADNATVTPFAAVTVSDPDVGQTETVTIAYTAANGSFGNLGGFTGAAGSYSFTGTTAAAQAALHGLVFTPTANQVAPGNTVSTAFALSVSDGVAAPVSNSQTTVVATSINDSPALGGITTAPQAVADNATVTPFAAVTVSDPDVGQTETVTIAYTAANGSFGNLGGFTGAAGSYSFTGTTAAAQAALHGLVFTPTANQVAPGNTVSTAFALSVSDGVAAPVSNSQTTVVATSINDSPALGGITTAPQAVADNATVTPFAAVTVSDPDVGQTETVTIAYTAANGSFGNLGGFTGAAGSYSFTGTTAAAQAALHGLVFTPTANQVAPGNTVSTAFALSVSDGVAAPVSNSQTTVVATSINDSPALGGITTAPQAVADNATVTPFAAVTVSDPDVGQTETVTIAYTAANGSFGNLGGFTGAAGSYSFTGTTAAAQAALHGLVFTPTANQVAPGNTVSTAFALSVSDGVAAPVSNSQTTVVATSINDSPALGGITTAPQAVADNATVTPFAAVTVSDPDVGQTETVTIAYTAANGSFGNLGGFTGAAGSYSFTGTTAAAQAALHGLVFTPTANQVAPGNTVSTAFALSVSDGVAAPVSNSQTTVVATSINDSPALGGITTAPQAVADNATVTPFAAVTVSDPDVGQTETVTIAYTAANGSFGNLGGFTGAAGSYSFTGTTAAAQAALHGLVFTPTANQVAPGNTVSTAFALSVSDGVAAPVSNSQTTVVATSINDSPALGGITTAPQAVADNATVTPFAAVTVSDPDVGQTETVTIAYTAANGSFGNLGGFTGAAGSYSFTGTTAAAQAALHGLVFTPTANQVAPGNTVSTAFALSVSDGVAAPVSNSQTTVVATSINDSPVLSSYQGDVNFHETAEGNAFLGSIDVDPDDTLHVVGVQYGGGLFSALPASGSVLADGAFGTLNIHTNGSFSYHADELQGAPSERLTTESFLVLVGDDHAGLFAQTLSFNIVHKPVADELSFSFTFTQASVSYQRGAVRISGPDGVQHDVGAVEHLQFEDGMINRADGAPLVDDLYYYAHNLDVWRAGIDADVHYTNYGWHEGRDPNAFFSTTRYFDLNPDVAAAGINPLDHYDSFGWHEGRDPSALFSTEAYRFFNADVSQAGVDPLAHYLQFGEGEGRAIFPSQASGKELFDTQFYLMDNADVAAAVPAGVNSEVFAFNHFLQYGWQEGRDPDALFSTTYYLEHYPDVAAAHIDPLLHYHLFGWREGRNPSPNFNSNDYLTSHPGLIGFNIDPLEDYFMNNATASTYFGGRATA